MRVTTKRIRGGGFTLIEVMLALAVVGIALLMASAAVHHQLLASDRFEARRQALRILEAGYESYRSGAMPASAGLLDLAIEAPPDSRIEAYSIVAESWQTDVEDLYQVRLIMRWRWRGEVFRESLDTRVYQP